MSKSYQHEIPLARVNITLDVETSGAKSKKELPLKLLMLGNYSNNQSQVAIADREKINVNKQNLNQVLCAFSPQVSMSVANHIHPQEEELSVNLMFNEFADFTPDRLVEQIPQLKKLMAMRNLLKDLKACVIDNQAFRKELEKILKHSTHSEALLQTLCETSPLSEA